MPHFTGIVVDDANLNIKYQGPWWVDTSGSRNDVGDSGPALHSTLHSVAQNANFTYEFQGTAIWVQGFYELRSDSNSGATWECFIDDQRLESNPPPPASQHSFTFCGKDQIPDGHHTLRAIVAAQQRTPFYFDYLNFVPSPNMPPIERASYFGGFDDSKARYEGNWTAGEFHVTQQKGAKVELSFRGNSISVFGGMPQGFPAVDGAASYQLDDRKPISFSMKSIGPSALAQSNIPLFETVPLVPGFHTVTIMNEGSDVTAPLVLSHWITQRGSNLPPSPDDSPTPTPSGTVDLTAPAGPRIGAIAGGVVGGVAVVILVMLLFLHYFRRRRRKDTIRTVVDPDAELPMHATRPFVDSSVSTSILNPKRPISLHPSTSKIHREAFGPLPDHNAAHQPLAVLNSSVRRSMTSGPQPGSLVDLPTLSQLDPPVSQNTRHSRLVFHEDSGFRIADAENITDGEAVDVPPSYTMS